MQFVVGVIVGVVGYMLIDDPTMLSDFLHGAGEWVTSYMTSENQNEQ